MKKLFLIVLIIFLILCVMASIFYITERNKSARLCDYIASDNTEDALALIPSMYDVNIYTALPSLSRLCVIFGGDIKLPLVEACRYGNYEIASALLQHGADPNKYLEGYFSPIEALFIHKPNESRLNICKLLVEYGADVNLNGSGEAALIEAVRNTMYTPSSSDIPVLEEVIVLLIDNNATPYDEKGNSIIHYLAFLGDVGLLNKISVRYDLQLDHANNQGQIPLDWAKSDEMIAYLQKETCTKE